MAKSQKSIDMYIIHSNGKNKHKTVKTGTLFYAGLNSDGQTRNLYLIYNTYTDVGGNTIFECWTVYNHRRLGKHNDFLKSNDFFEMSFSDMGYFDNDVWEILNED